MNGLSSETCRAKSCATAGDWLRPRPSCRKRLRPTSDWSNRSVRRRIRPCRSTLRAWQSVTAIWGRPGTCWARPRRPRNASRRRWIDSRLRRDVAARARQAGLRAPASRGTLGEHGKARSSRRTMAVGPRDLVGVGVCAEAAPEHRYRLAWFLVTCSSGGTARSCQGQRDRTATDRRGARESQLLELPGSGLLPPRSMGPGDRSFRASRAFEEL